MKIFSLVAVLLVLGACTSNPTKNGSNSSVNGEENGNLSTGYTDENISSGDLANIVPGTKEDLIENVGDRVFFTFNSASLNDSSQKTLARQSKWLSSYPDIKVVIEGHCDERGTREYNLALGERRAIAVKNYLVALGIMADRISTISYGKEHPEFIDSNEVSWSKNRRAVVVVE